MSQSVKKECDQLFDIPEGTITWDVPDFDEVSPTPQTDGELRRYADDTFQLVAAAVRDLAARPTLTQQ